MVSVYLWVKTAHIIAVIAWMAGLFYLPRLFVYHTDTDAGSKQASVFKTMEQRLYRIIMWPAMVATWLTGAGLVWILWKSGIRYEAWAWVKFGAVVLMSALHFRLGRHVSEFGADRSRYSSRYFRLINEAPTVLMILIVVMVVLKPF
ncbi:MAG TPA: protoporphyrinogen oxidase HemJ [Aestuariivirgaceae bacterium]